MEPERAFDVIREQFDSSEDEFTITLPEDVENKTFRRRVLPYAIGYGAGTHGLVNYTLGKSLTFKRTA